MASTKFLEEHLGTDVDEFTARTIVGGSLDTNSVTAPIDVYTSAAAAAAAAAAQLPHRTEPNEPHDSSFSLASQPFERHLFNASNCHKLQNNSDNRASEIYSASGGGGGDVSVDVGSATVNRSKHINNEHTADRKIITHTLCENNNIHDIIVNTNSELTKTAKPAVVAPTPITTTAPPTQLIHSSAAQPSLTEVANYPHTPHITHSHQLEQVNQLRSSQIPTQSSNHVPVKLEYPITSHVQPNIMHTPTSMATNSSTNSMTAQQPQTIVIKNQAANQNNVGNSMMPVQLVNIRQNAPVQQPRTVAAVQPRVVISNQHVVAARPTQPSGISLSALQQGQQGSTLLVKTETGQFRLLHVGPQTSQQNIPNTGANQTIRIQTVPSQIQSIASTTTAPIVVNSMHSTPTIHTGVTRSRDNIVTSQLPPVASVAPVTHSIAHPVTVQPQPQIQTQTMNVPNATGMTPTQTNINNTKEKCRKFLSNLLELSSREPQPVEQNVQELIQELIDANVEPDEFCNRLERLLNASPQPCLIGFLKKSLPLLRQSLYLKELTIDGIRPPSINVAYGTTYSPAVASQVRPVVPALASLQGVGQVRMVQPSVRPSQMARHQTPVRFQSSPINVPRMVNSAQIRGPSGAIIQQHPPNVQQIQSQPPALHPVTLQNSLTPGGAQIRATVARQTSVPIRHMAPENGAQLPPQTTKVKVGKANSKPNSKAAKAAAAAALAGSTQVINSSSVPPQPVVLTQPPLIVSSTNAMSLGANATMPIPTTSTSVISATSMNAAAPSAISSAPPKMVPIKSSAASSKAAGASKDKERKANASFYQQSSMEKMQRQQPWYGDDDINDVAAMGGVNLAEESQRILGSTELIGRHIRSCKDEVLLSLPALQARIRKAAAKHGLDEAGTDVAVLISHACQERLRNIVEKLAIIAEHRIDVIKIDPRYEITKDVRGQIKFLEELDKAEQKRHEEQEREMLMRAAKSRSKIEDPEQAKLKAKAKEMQRAEMEELRQRDANLTALQAIGPRKKPKLETDAQSSTNASGSALGTSSVTVPLRPRIKRVNLRDMIFFMEQERDTCRSTMLYKSYLK